MLFKSNLLDLSQTTFTYVRLIHQGGHEFVKMCKFLRLTGQPAQPRAGPSHHQPHQPQPVARPQPVPAGRIIGKTVFVWNSCYISVTCEESTKMIFFK